MKIVAATITPQDDRDAPYRAHVTIMSDGERYSDNCEARTPHEAVNAAFSAAVKAMSESVRKTIAVNVAVSF